MQRLILSYLIFYKIKAHDPNDEALPEQLAIPGDRGGQVIVAPNEAQETSNEQPPSLTRLPRRRSGVKPANDIHESYLLHTNGKVVDSTSRDEAIREVCGSNHKTAADELLTINKKKYSTIYAIIDSDTDINTYKNVTLRTYGNPGERTCFMHTGLVCYIVSSMHVKRCIIEKFKLCPTQHERGNCCSHCKWFLILRFYCNRERLTDPHYYEYHYKPFVVRFFYDLIGLHEYDLSWYDIGEFYDKIKEDLRLTDKYVGTDYSNQINYGTIIDGYDDKLYQKPGSYAKVETFENCLLCAKLPLRRRIMPVLAGDILFLKPKRNSTNVKSPSYLLSHLLSEEYPVCANIDSLLSDHHKDQVDSLDSCRLSKDTIEHKRTQFGIIRNRGDTKPATLNLYLNRFQIYDDGIKKYDDTLVDLEYFITYDGGIYALQSIVLALVRKGDDDDGADELYHYYPARVNHPTNPEEEYTFNINDGPGQKQKKKNSRLCSMYDTATMDSEIRKKSIVFMYEWVGEKDQSSAVATTTKSSDNRVGSIKKMLYMLFVKYHAMLHIRFILSSFYLLSILHVSALSK
jgi:hypothetical protein